MKKIILFTLLAVVLFTSCDRFGNKEIDGTKDIRIVCLSKQLTEMVFALGKGHDIRSEEHTLNSSHPRLSRMPSSA